VILAAYWAETGVDSVTGASVATGCDWHLRRAARCDPSLNDWCKTIYLHVRSTCLSQSMSGMIHTPRCCSFTIYLCHHAHVSVNVGNARTGIFLDHKKERNVGAIHFMLFSQKS
jgi:hypothetical protein